MSTETLPDRSPGQTIQFSWINLIRSIVSLDFVPRSLAGTPRANYARLGSPSYKFSRVHVQLSHLGLGDVLHFHDYAGNISVPQGWMVCDGSLINEANYDAQHSAGDWDKYVGSSVLGGLYLPNTDLAYIKGKTGTLQAGTAPITTVGSNTANLAHAHGSPITTSANSGSTINTNVASTYYWASPGHTHSLTIPSALSSAQDIRPSSTAVKIIMRIL